MTHASFSIFAMGTDQLHYIGWTHRSLSDEQDILSDLAHSGSGGVAHWVEQASQSGKINIFEIDSARTADDARDTVQFWCQYYGMLGAKVVTAHA